MLLLSLAVQASQQSLTKAVFCASNIEAFDFLRGCTALRVLGLGGGLLAAPGINVRNFLVVFGTVCLVTSCTIGHGASPHHSKPAGEGSVS